MRDVASIRNRLLAAVHQGLSIDAAWTRWDEGAFDWWPGGGVRQRFSIESQRAEDAGGAWWLVVETPVWHVTDPADLSRLRGCDRRPRSERPRRGRSRGPCGRHGFARVARAARCRVARVEPDARRVSGLGPVQARLARRAWRFAEEVLGPSAFAWRDDAPHPLHGGRNDLDKILALPERLILTRALSRPGEGAGHPRATADALVALQVGHPMRRGDDHLWLALDVGPRGALMMVSIMHHPLTAPSVAATTVLGHRLDPDAGRLEGEALLEAELAPGSRTWTLGSFVRDRFDRLASVTLMHTFFLPVGLFSEGYSRALARALGAKVESLRVRYGGSGSGPGIEAPGLDHQRHPRRSRAGEGRWRRSSPRRWAGRDRCRDRGARARSARP